MGTQSSPLLVTERAGASNDISRVRRPDPPEGGVAGTDGEGGGSPEGPWCSAGPASLRGAGLILLLPNYSYYYMENSGYLFSPPPKKKSQVFRGEALFMTLLLS